ncbi:sensor domain-containing diguanylate cyclase [Psychromonas sp. PT13]|uniref:sensor domain-containing diguanylate cyclase n=1 Tax=Psychromonas sp. PT13 TaxID=3439547 RepID=UPI003EBD8B78
MPEISIDSTYGVIIIQDMKVMSVDDNYARIYGYSSSEELLASIDSFLDLISPKFHAQAIQNCDDFISGKMSSRGQTFQNIDRHGREFTVFSIVHVIEWENSPAIQTTVIDLTPLVEMKSQLQENYQNYRNLILNSTQAIVLHRNFVPILVNQSWSNVMRATSPEFVLSQQSILDRLPVGCRDHAIQRNEALIAGVKLESENIIAECLCYDGEKRWFKITDNVIYWDGLPAVQGILEDITEKMLLEKELLYKATHDQLTNLFNRSAIYDWLEVQYRETKPIGCLLIDIDDFKQVNDNYGHQQGDHVIAYFASILLDIVAENGVAGRWGGEEFIVFLPNTSFEGVTSIAEKIRMRLHNHRFSWQQSEFIVTVSIGVSFSLDNQCRTASELIKEADTLLYLSKGSGKNKVNSLYN